MESSPILRTGSVMPDIPLFAVRLRELREAAKMSQTDLARVAKLSRQAVWRIENGVREPAWSSVIALCRALNVPVGSFDVEPSASEGGAGTSGVGEPMRETKPVAMGKRK